MRNNAEGEFRFFVLVKALVEYRVGRNTEAVQWGERYAPVHDGNEFDATGRPAFQPPNELNVADVTGYRTLRQVASGGSAEGFTVFGIGVRARLPFRVFTLAGPGSGSRLVIDIAHRW